MSRATGRFGRGLEESLQSLRPPIFKAFAKIPARGAVGGPATGTTTRRDDSPRRKRPCLLRAPPATPEKLPLLRLLSVRGGRPPPPRRLAPLPAPNCSRPLIARPPRGRHPPIHKAGCPRRSSGRPGGHPPFLRHAHPSPTPPPISIPPAHPLKLRHPRGRPPPPNSLTQTPPSPASSRATPKQLPLLRLLSVVLDGNVPPQIGSASSAELLHPRKIDPHRRRRPSSNKAGWDAPETAVGSVLRSSVAPTQSPAPPALFPFPPPSGPATCRGIPDLSPALRPGSCPPLAPAGAAQTQAGASGNRALPEPRPARHSPPPGCAFT